MEKGNRQRAILAGLALALVVGLLAFAQGPPTQVPDAMVQAPVTSFTAIRVLTPQGWVLAQPDSTIQIDTAATPPVIRAVVPSARTEARHTFLVAAPTQTFQLTALPAEGTSVKVYANGLLMAETYDYADGGYDKLFRPAAATVETGAQVSGGDIETDDGDAEQAFSKMQVF